MISIHLTLLKGNILKVNIYPDVSKKMLSEITTSPELLEMVSSTPEDRSEIDPSKKEKKGSYENLKKQVTSLKNK